MKFWIKFYTEILDDEKMGMLSDRLWRRASEMFLLAGYTDEGGLLPTLKAMAWRLRQREEDLETDLVELAKAGILNQIEGAWYVVNFEKRQAPSSNAERQKEYRQRRSNAQNNDGVTKRYKKALRNVTPEKRREEKNREEKNREEVSLPLPQTPLEASQHIDIQLFKTVSGVFPGTSDYRIIIDAAKLLRQTHPDPIELESYLLPFWLAWENLERKDGQPANKTNPTWFVEWAVNNFIPAPKREKVPVVSRSKNALANVRAAMKDK